MSWKTTKIQPLATNVMAKVGSFQASSWCSMVLPRRYMDIQATQMSTERKEVMRRKAPLSFHRWNLPHSVKRDCPGPRSAAP